ncbi:Protein CBG25426 [Caenorhabditis briggsae]|uniref:Protein CBG25426 n=1 Tax=Caenorhabditis briggsae TaxID=6238 RepID=B6IH78_CAEBR|nr:Protein CBG25426 [Caenorhabditis briggsae]CAR99258.1 Protein CBG25426 [Caenorhabditis briggsae]
MPTTSKDLAALWMTSTASSRFQKKWIRKHIDSRSSKETEEEQDLDVDREWRRAN